MGLCFLPLFETHMFVENNFVKKLLHITIFFSFFFFLEVFGSQSIVSSETIASFLGNRVKKNTVWVGNKIVSPTIPILVMAGHADSQGIEGEGTAGEAVGLLGYSPMDPTMSDELFWNLKIRDNVVKIGKQKSLMIHSYDPGMRTIKNENDYQTNWSVGARYSSEGVYVLELHFDAYGDDGLGSGLIPPLSPDLNNIDESLARTFGRYPLFFRGGLGAPRRQIRILEIGKLEGNLEKNLRDINSRKRTIDKISYAIVDAIIDGIHNEDSINLQLQEGGISLPDWDL